MDYDSDLQYDPDLFDDDNQVYLLAQQRSLEDHIAANKRQRVVKDQDEAMELAIQQSLQEQLEVQNRQSEELARQLHLAELNAADDELACALHQSEQQAEQEATQRDLNETAEAWRDQQSAEKNQDSWDCPQCTLVNPPYTRQCTACEAPAPPHVLVFEELPQQLRFGLEIEILIPNGKRDGLTLPTIANSLTTLGPPYVEFMGYTHQVTSHWKIVTDRSIQENNQNQDLTFEMVSPILQGEEGLISLRSIMENIRKLGIATNTSCGFHVHVDAEHGPLSKFKGLKRLVQCFISLENAFDLLVALSWERTTTAATSQRQADKNQYCRSNRLVFGSQSNRQCWNCIESTQSRKELVTMINPQFDRYRKLNITNITKHDRPSTVEFRHHGGVEDLREAEAWVRLLLAFCQRAGTLDANSEQCLLPERSPPSQELVALFNLLGCPGLEQFFTVERRLFDQARLRNEWECRVCHRTFQTSRDLGQHTLAVHRSMLDIHNGADGP